MKLDSLFLAGTALGAAALFLGTGTSRAFTLNGNSLGLSQRDVRVFDNFTDASANNNVTPDSNWPGYTGAELAIWKACSEWGSVLHGGTGAGDPLQTVGSGGANLDISWQGNATSVGGPDDNTHSEISGSSGGILAYTELPSFDGWRIRYYETWAWHDGPGSVPNGIDLQGVATSQYGHALGLSFSSVPGATMANLFAGSGTQLRSIEADDIAGLQAVYGAKAANKTEISSVALSGGNQVTIVGQNFSLANNEVWFTQAGQGGTGDPVVVSGVTSNGTSITVAIPAGAGPGDVLVRSDGTAYTNLSNAWPFDPNGTTCPIAVYCTAKLSSNLCLPSIGATGIPSFFNPTGFTVTTTAMESGVVAIDFFGTTGQAAIPFQGGVLCAASPIHRLGGKPTGGAGTCTGSIGYTLQEVMNHSAGGPLVTFGAVVNMQTWGRDLGDPFGSSLSDAIEFTVCP